MDEDQSRGCVKGNDRDLFERSFLRRGQGLVYGVHAGRHDVLENAVPLLDRVGEAKAGVEGCISMLSCPSRIS
jgi:hypothetical protein